MDHHLDDSLNLEETIGVDFEHATDVVVSQGHMALDSSSHVEGIPMEFENIEEQTMLMETGSEEIIVPELMGDQFTLSADGDYAIQDEHLSEPVTLSDSSIICESNAVINSNDPHSIVMQDSMMELQFDPQNIIISTDTRPERQVTVSSQSAVIKVQRATAPMPRQVAIAPKPPAGRAGTTAYAPGKQCAIAPKPVTVLANRAALKKVPLSTVLKTSSSSASSMLAQIGKQYVMVPAGAHKLKLVPSSSGSSTLQYVKADAEQAQLMKTKTVIGSQGTKVAKVIQVQGHSSDQQAVLTKLVPGATAGTRLITVQQHRTGLGLPPKNKVLVGYTNKGSAVTTLPVSDKLVTIKCPTSKLLPAQSQLATKKILIPANPPQNVLLKAAISKPSQPPKTGGNLINVTGGRSRTQVHQVDIPGKGIQFIRLVTSVATTNKPAPAKPQFTNSVFGGTQRTLVLTDSKGNIMQMDKLGNNSSPVLVSGNNVINKLTSKPQQKLVRIAPVSQANQSRPSQSLLAPLVSEEMSLARSPSPPAHEAKDALRQLVHVAKLEPEPEPESEPEPEPETEHEQQNEVEIEFERMPSPAEDDSRLSSEDDEVDMSKSGSNRLIVFPPNYCKNEQQTLKVKNLIDINEDSIMDNNYEEPKSPQDDTSNVELGLRPRKACHCNKSQCLKLYCDCFANGEFCNLCNCTNCHNNLEHEDLRQKAIRGCLERNPDAFRPKIGKAKTSGGPTIVRRHNKGCNCKRSGCLKNYCECYEAKIACSAMCRCVGCRNVEESVERARRLHAPPAARPLAHAPLHAKQPCSLVTTEVIEAACQCLLAAAAPEPGGEQDAACCVLEEFARCLQEIIGTAHHAALEGERGEREERVA